MTDSIPPLLFPAREAIAAMEPFTGLELEHIKLVTTPQEAENAVANLLREPALGFDTESQPTFKKGQLSQGPHVLQFSTPHKAYIFQTHRAHSKAAVAAVLESCDTLKIGFGLRDDIKRIAGKLMLQPNGIIDLDATFKHHLGQKNSVGVKTAIATLFNRRLIKSRKATTSNWANPSLTEKQIIYAANDAYAALIVYAALKERGMLLE